MVTKAGGYTADQLKIGGYTADDLKTADYPPVAGAATQGSPAADTGAVTGTVSFTDGVFDLRELGYTDAELTAAGYTTDFGLGLNLGSISNLGTIGLIPAH